jgi:hypothetical protein
MTTTRAIRWTASGLAADALWPSPVPASAQDPCAAVFKQAAQVMGAPAGETESVSPTQTTRVCTVRSTDGAADISLTIETSPSAARRLPMAKALAAASKDPDQKVQDEPALGPSAFSLREKDTVTFMMADPARFLTLRVGKDRGMADADVERARQLARQLLGAR